VLGNNRGSVNYSPRPISVDDLGSPAGSLRVSIMLEVGFCIEDVEEALARHGRPEIFSSGAGSQFTSAGLVRVLPTPAPRPRESRALPRR
jgi:hypothetical protein